LKARGRKRSPGEKDLLAQVSREFRQKKKKIGAKEAAKQLNVCLASFYKYTNGKALPRTEVLRRAHIKWGIKWSMLDFSQFMRTKNVWSPEQLALSFMDAVRGGDVEILRIDPVGESHIQVKLRIRFQPLCLKNSIEKA